jgi:hypothetical protein
LEIAMQPQKLIFFGLGALAIALSVAMAFGSAWLLRLPSITDLGRPGIGITAIAYLDLIFVYTLTLIGLDFLPVAPALFARIQGIVTFIISLVGVLGSFALILLTFTFLMMMISLFLTVPFGTVAYLAIWGDFDTAGAKVILAVVMILKLAGVGFILFASLSFLKNKGFMVLTMLSLGLSFLLGLLHALPPGILVSITDAVGALITYIVLLVWAFIQLIGSLFAILRALRSVLPA